MKRKDSSTGARVILGRLLCASGLLPEDMLVGKQRLGHCLLGFVHPHGQRRGSSASLWRFVGKAQALKSVRLELSYQLVT